jgi:hypothetical protein
MKKGYYISIPKPCSENWSNMTVVERDRFCAVCNKKVFDFSQSTDKEINKAIIENPKLCGKFNSTQLNRELIINNPKKNFWFISTTSILTLIGINNNAIYAQDVQVLTQTEKKVALGLPTIEQNEIEFTTQGRIIDENESPLANVLIRIKGKDNVVYSNSNGLYSVKVKSGDTLIYTLNNYSTIELKADYKNKNAKIYMENIQELRNYKSVVVGGLYVRKRSFLGKIFYSIGKLFK